VLPGLPITVVRNAVDVAHFTPAERDGAEMDRLAGLPSAEPGTVRVGLVATYANWKGHDLFLDALAQLPATSRVRGYVVGGPIYATTGSQFTREELERQAAANGLTGRVGFVPFQPDPADAYRMLDVVVHASTRPEPFGLTIAEAMSCGRPVVVAADGGAVELFTPNEDALGYPPGNVAALAHAVARLAADPNLRRRLGERARQTAVERFTVERFGRELADVYSRAIALSNPWVDSPSPGRGDRG
jgi:glycosyltransferase involved in cell wall biosynthesis